MKRYSKTQLKEQATEVFKQYPNTEALYATSDGQFFLEKNRADLHANENKLSVMNIEKDWTISTASAGSATKSAADVSKDETEKSSEHHLSVDELQEKVKACTDTAELKQWLEEEQKLEKPRKTAIACLEKRLKELVTST